MAASTRKLATFATGSTPRLVAARSVRVFPSSEPTSRPSRTPVNLACSGRVARATASGPGKLLQTHSPSAAPLLPLTFAPSNVHRDDPPFFTSPQHPPAGPISPEEYRLRLGRALDLLRATLPDLLRIGIADYDHSSASQAERSAALGPVFSNNIHFRFLPSPEHDDEPGSAADAAAAAANLGFSGRGLYLASAHVLRHALSAIFAEGRVDLERIKLVDGSGKPCSAAMASLPAAVAQHDSSSNATKQASTTKHAILARITYSGKLRVTGQPQSYTLRFRYEFDHLGQINLHVVERIEPAVGRKVSRTARFGAIAHGTRRGREQGDAAC
ncbi:hypothetical protein IE81DRAFT_65974 [Ceraceosorus guamensis]|uniref:Uncharacterized protein n=1 Tax=Ceraceosorus guamensis TaxID=1522189 RepID=A0A316W1N9_9BASI|nr:hypothetical protein IE81DRAFT_65974 [Ceraceosorus guamensis]PWN43700.1 hypothetical protein IE81DRAFT_65974 [Ceraceosorus guamensis]